MPATAQDILTALAELRAYLDTRLDALEKKLDAKPSASAPANGGPTLPNYGRAKGRPIRGADMGDLEYYAEGCRKSLGDKGKRRWWDKERVMLAAIEAEIARQGGGKVAAADFAPDSDADVPF